MTSRKKSEKSLVKIVESSSLLDALISEQASAVKTPDMITIADYSDGLRRAGIKPPSPTTITHRLDSDKRLKRVNENGGMVFDQSRRKWCLAWVKV